MAEEQKASFQIINILVTESYFKRENDIDFEKEIPQRINIDKSVQVVQPDFPKLFNTLVVTLKTDLEGLQDDKVVYRASVTVVGVFEKTGEGELNEEMFGNVNGPAILYPFTRENIANLCLKGGLGSIFLHPINFQKLGK